MKKEIKDHVLSLTKGKRWCWQEHIEGTVNYALLLADKLGADREVVLISAWLHDIHKIRAGKDLHHLRGAEEAAALLEEHGYPEELIRQVRHCIETHSSDRRYPPETIEAKIVASADALSHIDLFLEITYHTFGISGRDISEGRDHLRKKYASAWSKMIPQARELGAEKYEAILLILG